jgi:hypothetical protein
MVGDEVDVPSNTELNKKRNDWAWDNIPERNRMRHVIRRKLTDCKAATTPLVERVTSRLARIWTSINDVLGLIFLPPLALLVAGWVFGCYRFPQNRVSLRPDRMRERRLHAPAALEEVR